MFKEVTGLPFEIENDVNAAALGEKWLSSLKGIKDGVCLTIGTGIGGAILLNGKNHSGINYTFEEIDYMDIGKDDLQERRLNY